MKTEVRDWLIQASEDFDTAIYNFQGNRLNAAAFFSQQATEKALKAVYIDKFERLWKTHDLKELAKEVAAPTRIIELCITISPAYIATRYPGLKEKYKKKEVQELIESAEEVIEWTKNRLR